MSQWVRHISGQGEKWEVTDAAPHFWEVRKDVSSTIWVALRLPKSEFTLCEPPEVWRDVTSTCHEIDAAAGIPELFRGGIADENKLVLFQRNAMHGARYRLRKVQVSLFAPGPYPQWAFIIEQREP